MRQTQHIGQIGAALGIGRDIGAHRQMRVQHAGRKVGLERHPTRRHRRAYSNEKSSNRLGVCCCASIDLARWNSVAASFACSSLHAVF